MIECIPDSTKLLDPRYGNFLGLLERKFKETIFGKVTPTRLLHNFSGNWITQEFIEVATGNSNEFIKRISFSPGYWRKRAPLQFTM